MDWLIITKISLSSAYYLPLRAYAIASYSLNDNKMMGLGNALTNECDMMKAHVIKMGISTCIYVWNQ